MKIKDLIELLGEYNQEADITLTTSEDITVSYICSDTDGKLLTKETTMQCFIEGRDFIEEI